MDSLNSIINYCYFCAYYTIMPIGRAIGRNLFKMMAGKGYSSRALIRMAKQLGGGYHNQTMFDDIRKFEGRIKYEPLVRSLNPTDVVPKRLMVETDLGVDARYRVHGMATFYDEEIDDYYEQKVSFYTNEWENEDAYSEAFADSFQGVYQEEMLDFTSFTRTGQEHNKKWTY